MANSSTHSNPRMEDQHSKRTIPLAEYAQELRAWLQMSQQCQMANFSYQMSMINAHAASQRHINSTPSAPTATPQPQIQVIGRPGARNIAPRAFPLAAGAEIKIPTVGKRAAAELIDCVLLYCVKFFLTYLLVTYGGVKASHVLDFDYAYFISGEMDLDDFVQLSSEIVLVEFIHRLFVSVYEALCLTYVTNIIPPGGFTPGKRMMGLAIIGCDEVFSLGNERFLVTGMRNPSLYSSLIRSLIKNFSLSVLVPTSLTALMFDHRRAVYDLLAGTVVIELT